VDLARSKESLKALKGIVIGMNPVGSKQIMPPEAANATVRTHRRASKLGFFFSQLQKDPLVAAVQVLETKKAMRQAKRGQGEKKKADRLLGNEKGEINIIGAIALGAITYFVGHAIGGNIGIGVWVVGGILTLSVLIGTDGNPYSTIGPLG